MLRSGVRVSPQVCGQLTAIVLTIARWRPEAIVRSARGRAAAGWTPEGPLMAGLLLVWGYERAGAVRPVGGAARDGGEVPPRRSERPRVGRPFGDGHRRRRVGCDRQAEPFDDVAAGAIQARNLGSPLHQRRAGEVGVQRFRENSTRAGRLSCKSTFSFGVQRGLENFSM